MATAATNLSIAVRLVNEAKSDLAKLDKDLGAVGTTAQKSSGPLGGMGSALGGVAKIAGGFIVAQGLMKLPGLIGGMTGSASDLNESLSKARVVFGESAAGIEKFASSAAKSLGISKQAALEAAGSLGNLFQTMGVGQAPAAEMSKSMVTLAADLASFNNLDPTEVLDKLRSGLVGEAEPLRALGVGLTAATVEAKALALGFRPINGELSEGAKVQARYALILEQTTSAQGDFARTADGAANQQRILAAQSADLSAELGSRLLPVQIALQKFMIDKLVPALLVAADWLGPKLSAAISQGGPALRDFAMAAIPAVLDALTSLLRGFNATVNGISSGLTFLAKLFTTIMSGILDVVTTVGMAIYEALQWLNPFAEHSPSLVSQVEKGAAQIMVAYANMATATEDLRNAGGAVESLGAAFGAMTAQVEAVANDKVLAALSKIGGAEGVAAYTEAQAAVEALGHSYEIVGGQIAIASAEVEKIRTDLDDAKSAFERFARAAIAESVPFTQASKDIEYQIAAIQLKINELKQGGGLTMTVGTGKFDKSGIEGTEKVLTAAGKSVEDYEKQLEALGLQAENVRLKEKLKIGPMQDQIDALTDTTEKLTFAEIIKGLKESKDKVDKLTPAYASQSGALKTLQASYDQIGSQLKTFQGRIASVSGEAVRQFDAMAKAAGGGSGGAGGAAAALGDMKTKMEELQGEDGPMGKLKVQAEDIKKSFADLKVELGETKEKLDPLLESMGGMAKSLAENKDFLIALILLAASYATAVGVLTVAIAAVDAATWLLVAGQTALNVVMAINPFVAIGIAIVALVAIIVLLVQHWDDLTAKYPALKTFSDDVVKVFNAIKDAIKAAVDWVKDHWQEIGVALLLVTGPIGILVLAIIKFKDDIIAAFKAAVDWVKDHFGEIKDKISDVIGDIAAFAKDAMEAGKGIATGIYNGIITAAQDIWLWVAGFPGLFLSFLANFPQQMWDMGEEMISWLVGGIKGKWHALVDGVVSLLNPRNWPAWRSPFPESMYKEGFDIGELAATGVADGIKSGTKGLQGAMDGVGAMVIAWGAGIHSLVGQAFSDGGGPWTLPGPWDSPGWHAGGGSGGGWGIGPPPIVPVGPPIPWGGPGVFSPAHGAGQQQPIQVSVQIDGREIAYAMANQSARSFA